jgi:hypothetical protein
MRGWVAVAVATLIGPLLCGSMAMANSVVPDVVTSFESVNIPGYYLRHRFALGELTRIDNDLDRQDASFMVRPALSGTPGAVSFESVN